jgi:tetratricopeptide (TPR) repeat protein
MEFQLEHQKGCNVLLQAASERDKGNMEEAHRLAAEAESHFDLCAKHCPEAWLGVACETQQKGSHDEAIARYLQVLHHATTPKTLAVAYNNLGGLLSNRGNKEEAMACFRKSWDISRTGDAANNIGLAIKHLGDLGSALKWFDDAIRLDPRQKQIYMNRALTLLLMGDYENGFQAFESRWAMGTEASRKLPVFRPEWNGQDLNGKTILVYFEQGAGDTIQFARFGKELKARGAKTLLAVQKGLQRLLKPVEGWDEVTQNLPELIAQANIPHWDYQIGTMSLGRVLNLRSDGLDGSTYLSASGADLELPAGFKVGICWAGYLYHGNDAERSTNIELWKPLFSLPAHFYSLQVGPRSLDLENAGYPVVDLSGNIKDFADTANAIRQMDLVIAVDTSVAHIAGAMGIPCWCLQSWNPDWRWMLNRTDSPWYKSIQLFRQPAYRDWSGVFDAVYHSLRAKLDTLQLETVSSIHPEPLPCASQ